MIFAINNILNVIMFLITCISNVVRRYTWKLLQNICFYFLIKIFSYLKSFHFVKIFDNGYILLFTGNNRGS